MQASRRWIAGWTLGTLMAGAALAGQGCSHAPKPTADPTPSAPSEAAPPPHNAARTHKETKETRETKETKETKPATSPADGVVSGSSTTAAPDSGGKPPVVPTLTQAQAKEMELLSKNNVEAAQTMLNSLDPAKLDDAKAQKYQIAKGFLADAITARAQQDWMRAAQLATKAKILAEELTSQ